MLKAKPVNIENFQGGLVLQDSTIIPDNALSVAKNVFYNVDRLLQTRYGQTNFGNPIPDSILVIHNADSVSANGTWAVSDDGINLTASGSQKKRGTAALKFDIDVSASANNDTLLTNSTMSSKNITSTKGYLGFFLFIPTGGKTNLTNLRIRLGSSSSDYYQWTIQPAQLTENAFNFFGKKFSDATITGSPDDAAINYFQYGIFYNGSYVDVNGWGLDDIVVYSGTSSKPVMSLKYFESSIQAQNFPRYLHVNCGTNLFEYDEDSQYWNVIKTGLTENTRFSMAAYKNIMYFTNGVDNYFSYDGIVCTDHTGGNTYKGKYLIVANDIGYILGDPSVPSSLAYTAANPANLNIFPNVLVLDEDGSDGVGSALNHLGPIVLAGKQRKVYEVNVAAPSRQTLDYSDGIEAHRAFININNNLVFPNSGGIYTLGQRQATVGSLRVDSISENIQRLTDDIKNKEFMAAIWINQFNNAYFSADLNEDGIPDTCLVLSTLVKKWTIYEGISANEFVYWKDKNGDYHMLYASATGGQVVEMETGTNDFNLAILHEIEGKSFNFGDPLKYKTTQHVDISGFINETGLAEAYLVFDDGYETPVAYINGANYVSGASSDSNYTLGDSPLGETELGGSNSDSSSIILYSFKIRIPIEYTGITIKPKFRVNQKDTVFIPQKVTIYPYGEPIDLFDYNLIQ